MPELPEVERTRLMLEPVMRGARFERVVLRRADLRAPFLPGFAGRLLGQSVTEIERRGKYLLATLSSGDTLVMHLGMSGAFRIDPGKRAVKDEAHSNRHDHVVFQMSTPATIVFNDPRRFGSMDLIAPGGLSTHRVLGGLGPEPLSREFDAAHLARVCRGKRTSLKAALLDQRVVAGLGNIYASEALHRARLSPKRRASTVSTRDGAPRDSAVRLVTSIKAALLYAIGRHDDIETERHRRFRVYDREGAPCPRRGCRGTIVRIVQNARSSFYCPVCQR